MTVRSLPEPKRSICSLSAERHSAGPWPLPPSPDTVSGVRGSTGRTMVPDLASPVRRKAGKGVRDRRGVLSRLMDPGAQSHPAEGADESAWLNQTAAATLPPHPTHR
jgi:hypothetical protein